MLTIHVGLHKTGSTSIQSYLRGASRAELNGLRVLDPEPFKSGAGFQIPSADKSLPKNLRKADFREDYWLSSESFLGAAGSYGGAMRAVENMKLLFESKTSFRLLLYLRPQTELVRSLYVQTVKQGSNADFMTSFGSWFTHRYASYGLLVRDLQELLEPEQLIVRIFSPEHDVVKDALQIMGLPVKSRPSTHPRQNLSLSTSLTELLRRINGFAGPMASQEWRFLLGEYASEALQGNHSPIPTGYQRRLRIHTSEDWKSLAQLTLAHPSSRPSDFEAVARDQARLGTLPQLSSRTGYEDFASETARLLVDLGPTVFSSRKKASYRLRKLTSTISQKMRSNPGDILRATKIQILKKFFGRRV